MSINLNNHIRLVFSLLLAVALFAVSAERTLAQVSFPPGVNSCGSGGGALSGGIGSSRPLGGPFVPVADYAVELNTATLVYKECILRITVNTQKKAAAALITRDTINKFMTQRNGGPMFPVVMLRDMLVRQNGAMVRGLQDSTLEPLNPSFRDRVRGAVALSYRVDTQVRNNTIACPEPNIGTIARAQDFSFGLLWTEADPRCQPLYAYYGSKEILRQDMADDNAEMMYRLTTSNGVYGVEAVDAQGNRMTLSPGIFVQENVTQAVQSGFEMLIHADDIGEITDSLYASMADTSMTGTGGLSTTQGFANLTGGLPGGSGGTAASTYLDQVLRNQFGNGGGGTSTTSPSGTLAVLEALYQQEIQYLAVVEQQSRLILRASQSIASSSEACWGTRDRANDAFEPYAERVTRVAYNLEQSRLAATGLDSLITSMKSSTPPSPQQVSQQLMTLNTHSKQETETAAQDLADWDPEFYPQFVESTVDGWRTISGVLPSCAFIPSTL